MAFDSAKMMDYLLEAGADPNVPTDVSLKYIVLFSLFRSFICCL
jgi:hypothetical protein